jgi:hypothetical protein
MLKKPALWWTLSLLASAAVALLLLWPGQHLPKGPNLPWFDKLVHLALFAVLTFSWMVLAGLLRPKPYWLLLWIAAGVSAYGLALEWAQQAIAMQRSFDWWDWLADTAGALLAWLLLPRWLREATIPSNPKIQSPSAP